MTALKVILVILLCIPVMWVALRAYVDIYNDVEKSRVISRREQRKQRKR